MRLSVVSQLDETQRSELMQLYAEEFWCNRRTREGVEKMLAHTSIIVGLVDEDGHLVAFARVLTDFVYRATLYDVIVAEAHRGTGVGARLMDAVLQHPGLREVEHVSLNCTPRMLGFYRRWNFTEPPEQMRTMLRRQPIV